MSNVSINVFNLRKEYMKNTKANRTTTPSILQQPWILISIYSASLGTLVHFPFPQTGHINLN